MTSLENFECAPRIMKTLFFLKTIIIKIPETIKNTQTQCVSEIRGPRGRIIQDLAKIQLLCNRTWTYKYYFFKYLYNNYDKKEVWRLYLYKLGK